MNSSPPVRFAVFVLVATICLCQWSSAYADWDVADVQCVGDENRFLVRFGMNGEHDAPIPLDLSAKWRNVPAVEVSGAPGVLCRFRNGQKILISIATSQEVKTSGGGDLSGYFSLLINGKIIYRDERFYQGQNLSIYDFSALEYDGKTFLACNPHEVDNFMGVVSIHPECHLVFPPGSFGQTSQGK